jgi:hypothetical protein
MAVEAYRLLAKQIDQPLHLGITEAGGLRGGTVKSAIGLGMLLYEGIGDTIRVSLAADPVEESQGRLRDPQEPQTAHQRHQLRRLSELFAAELRRHRHHERARAVASMTSARPWMSR